MGQLVGQDLDATSSSRTFGSLILFLSPCRMMHAWHWRSTSWSTFCTSADSGVLSVRSYLLPIRVRQAYVEYISTATEHPAQHKAVCSIVVMHAWRCATSLWTPRGAGVLNRR